MTEKNRSEKVGSGGPTIGNNKTIGALDRVRVDSTDRVLTHQSGVSIGNQSSLKAGLRGPTLLEDFPDAAVAVLTADGRALEFLKDQYRHCKPILALGSGAALLSKAGIPQSLPTGKPDPGLLIGRSGDVGSTAKHSSRRLHGTVTSSARATHP